MHTKIQKGQQIPQTVESLLSVMEADAVVLQKAHNEISQLKQKQNTLSQRESKARRRILALEEWIADEGLHTNTCTYSILSRVCGNCNCKRRGNG